jgi:hypothetical protein
VVSTFFWGSRWAGQAVAEYAVKMLRESRMSSISVYLAKMALKNNVSII